MTNALEIVIDQIPDHIIRWQTCRNKILKELDLVSPDILCVEVDCYDDLNEELVCIGYRSVFKARTGIKVDVPCFGGQNRFDLLDDKSTEFSNHNLHNNCGSKKLCSTTENMTPTNFEGSDDHVICTVYNINIFTW